jgi:TP901 family phage tail tape measure protein
MDKSSQKIDTLGKKSQRTLTRLQRLRKGFKQLSSATTGLQSQLAGVVSTVGGIALIRGFTNFETAVNSLNAITLATDEQMQRMRKTAKKLGETTQFSASDAARGMTLLAMAGLSVDQSLAAIPKTLQLAAAGGLDLAAAADISTNVLAQMGMTVGELARINDVLSLAQAKANFNVLELFEAMRPTAVTAKNLGISLEELTAVLGTMANAGERGSIAGTLLRNALTQMAGPSAKQIKIYKLLNINLRDFVAESGQIKNLTGFIGKLSELQKSGKLTVPILQALFGERGFRAVQILAGAGADEIDRLERSLAKAGGTAEKMAEIRMRGLPGVLLAAKSALEAVNIAVFESGLDEFLIKVIDKITKLARSIAKVNPSILKIVAFFGLTAIVIGPLIIAFGILSASITAIVGSAAALGTIFAAIGSIFVVVGSTIAATAAVIGAPFLAVAGAIIAVSVAIDQLRANWATITAPGFFKDLVGWMADFTGISPLETRGQTADRTAAMNGTLNGRIDITTAGGAGVRRAEMTTTLPGNLGFNMGGVAP